MNIVKRCLVRDSLKRRNYYCELCSCHMHNQEMWESHIAGKRHLKNSTKTFAEPVGKSKPFKTSDATAVIQRRLNNVRDPIVGLNYTYEIQNSEDRTNRTYTCTLCHDISEESQIIDHLISTKHRMNFFREVGSKSYKLVERMCVDKNERDSIVRKKARKWEDKHGRGYMGVKVKRKKTSSSRRKRHYYCNSSEDDESSNLNNSKYNSWNDQETAKIPRLDQRGSFNSLKIKKEPIKPLVRNRDIILGSMRNFAMTEKVALLEVLSTVPIMSPNEARVALQVVDALSRSLIHYKAQCLPPQMQGKLMTRMLAEHARDIEKFINECCDSSNSSGDEAELRSC